MALPAFPTNNATNNTAQGVSASSGVTYGYPMLTGSASNAIVQNTAFKAQNTSGGAVTCNLATDTLIYLPEGTVWDDTQQCWVPPFMLNLGPTPRK